MAPDESIPDGPDDDLHFAGLDGTTGRPLYPALAPSEAAALACARPPDANETAEATAYHDARRVPGLGPRETIDPKDLGAAGWGVIFPQDGDPAIREALAPLLAWRETQAAAREERYFRVFAGEDGYQPGERKLAYLARHGAGPGPADPERVPYYLLLAGSPAEIPWSFQQQLALQYAVGRLALDTPDDYAHYAESVIAAETAPPRRAPEVVFFGVENPDDKATRMMAKHLIRQLPGFLAGQAKGWDVRTVPAAEATKARLARLLGGEETPAVLFTTSHGMGFPAGHACQRPHQGALVCQDWEGPAAAPGPIPQDAYFAADDLAADARPHGMIAFHYACHGAGTPQLDAYPQRALQGAGVARERATVAPEPFVARLPQRLLAHPRGGALAVVGHVERAFCYSFLWDGAGGQAQIFADTLLRLLSGYPVGAAFEPFSLRFGEIAAALTAEIEEIDFGAPVDERVLTRLWTAHNDARSYAILGDPAVRLGR